MDFKQKTIDVIIPVYNGEKYIAEAINSVIRQKLKPRRIIIVNDGSTDKTLDKIEEFRSTNLTNIKIINQINKGLSEARNTGIKESNADFIAFLDHDDVWLPDKLLKQIEVFNKSKVQNLGLVYCMFQKIDTEGHIVNSDIAIDRTNKGNNLLNRNINKNIIIGSGSGVLIKKECFDNVGYFDKNLKAFEDWDMWLRIITKYGIDYSTEILVQIREHQTNMQKNYYSMLKNQFIFYKKWFLIALNKNPSVLILWIYRLLKNLMRCVIKSKIKNETTARVSVIIPVYNGEKYIVETLESLICQSNFIKELIIVNDGSTDKTKMVVEKFKKEKDFSNIIILLNNKFKKGISGSLNTGIELSTAEYIARADGDDIYFPNRILKQIKFLDNHPKIDLVGSSFITFGKNIKSKKVYKPIFSTLIAFLGIRDTSICHPTVMFRRDIIQTTEPYPYVEVEDYAFFSEILKKHRAINLIQPTILYRRHINSYSINLLKEKPLIESTEKKFKENYLYYTSSLQNIQLFSDFLNRKKVDGGKIFILFLTSHKILHKIKSDYSIKFYSIDFFASYIYICALILFVCFKNKLNN